MNVNPLNLGRNIFVDYSAETKQLVISQPSVKRGQMLVLDQRETVRLRVYLNDLVKRGL